MYQKKNSHFMYPIFLANVLTFPQQRADQVMNPINLHYPQCVSDSIQYLTWERQAPNFLETLSCTCEKPTKLLLDFFESCFSIYKLNMLFCLVF